jgi:hypothetical protein
LTRTAKIAAAICLALILGVASVARGAEHPTQTRGRHQTEVCFRTKHHKRVCRPRKKKSIKPAILVAPKPTTSVTTAQAAAPSETKLPATPTAPVCPANAPLPTPIVGQATIVGYANAPGGGPAPQPGSGSCPERSGGVTVVLETATGQVLESQTLAPGQPFDFIVQPGEYQVLNGLCMEGPRVTALAGQQTETSVACSVTEA